MKKNKIKILLTAFLSGTLVLPFFSNAQEKVDKKEYQREFDSFKKSISQDFDLFKQHNDSIFIQFLSQSWKDFNGVLNPIPTLPKPVQQPKVNDPFKNDAIPERLIPEEFIKGKPVQIKPEPVDSVPLKIEIMNKADATSILFYGTEIEIPMPNSTLPVLKVLTENGIIQFFSAAAESSILNSAIRKAKENAGNCRLNDWGLASLMHITAQKLYNTRNEQILFTWYALIRCGLNPKVGYNKEKVYLLLPVTEKVYSVSYLIKNKNFYLISFDFNDQQPTLLSIYETDYPGNKPDFSFLIIDSPRFGNQKTMKTVGTSDSFDLNLNKNLIDFYNQYPECELKVFFKAPLSDELIMQLDKHFNPVLKGKTDDERVSLLLNFVQSEIPYKTDQEQFSREKYLFAEETLFYPGADCEDRSILLAKLIERYTQLETIGLLYPEHVSL